MNYLKQILSLNQIQLNNPLSQGQFMLYHALLDINNQCAWKEWFEVANLRLQTYTGLTRQGIAKCRNELRQRGYIDFKTNGTKASSYKIFTLYDNRSLQAGLQAGLQVGLQAGCQDSLQAGCQVVDKLVDEQLTSSCQVGCTLDKQNKTKLNESKEKVEKEKSSEPLSLSQKKKKKSSKFIPPTIEEVRSYCQERKNNIDPEQFVAFYSSKGWKVGAQPMKDWKMAVITWEKRNNKTISAKPKVDRSYDLETANQVMKKKPIVYRRRVDF